MKKLNDRLNELTTENSDLRNKLDQKNYKKTY